MTENLNGILLIDKPKGITSHDVVAKVRRLFGIKKVGHAGTLDPMATGLLILLIGRATKTSQYLIGLSKCYEGTMHLGTVTDSHDAEGNVVETHEVPEITLDGLQGLADTFIGDQYQVPPMFSAKKVNGQKLYKLARNGTVIDREPQFININTFEIDDIDGNEVTFFVSCSKGTYVRTLVHDFGQKLGCGAHLTQLCRTDIENFSIEDAVTLERLESMNREEYSNILIPVHKAVPSRVLNNE